MTLENVVLSFLAILFWGFAIGWLIQGLGPVEETQNWLTKLAIGLGSAIMLYLSGWPFWVIATMAGFLLAGAFIFQIANAVGVSFKGSPALTHMFILYLVPVGLAPILRTQDMNTLGMTQLIATTIFAVLAYVKYEKLAGNVSSRDAIVTVGIAMVTLIAPVVTTVVWFF